MRILDEQNFMEGENAENTRQETKGRKDDSQKVRLDLIPVLPLIATARVLTKGAVRYSDHNWRAGIKYSRVIAACERHLMALKAGYNFDIDSGELHAAHLICEAMFLAEYMLDPRYADMGLDDRWHTLQPDGRLADYMVIKNDKSV